MNKKMMALAAVLALAGVVWAAGRPGIVRLKDGTLYDGTIEEIEGGLKINVRGIETTVPSDRVAEITYGDFETRWNQQYEKLAKEDVAGRIALARRAFDERQYDLAEKALRDASTIDPNNAEAAELLKLTISQRRLERGSGATGTATTGGNTGTAAPAGGPPSAWVLLSPEQVNRIKQVEMREDDPKLRFSFKNNVRKQYVDNDPTLGMNYTAFTRLPLGSQAATIIRNGRDLAKDVEVVNDPEVMLAFRRDVMPLVLQGCATSACHGGNNDASKAFALVSPAADAASVYTNFLTLQQFQKRFAAAEGGSIFTATSAFMIDRVQPEKSLLLQYGLPQQEAEFKHPVVRNYNGIFRAGTRDVKYTNIRNFIGMLNKTPSDYGFSFELKRKDATPATPPATQPDGAAGMMDGLRNRITGQ